MKKIKTVKQLIKEIYRMALLNYFGERFDKVYRFYSGKRFTLFQHVESFLTRYCTDLDFPHFKVVCNEELNTVETISNNTLKFQLVGPDVVYSLEIAPDVYRHA